jgi:hypothetical protein
MAVGSTTFSIAEGRGNRSLPWAKANSARRRRGQNPLIMLDLIMSGLIPVTQLPLDLYQVLHVHAGGEGVSASSAFRRLLGLRDILVKANTNLRRALKDMEELSKREPEKRDDHRYRVSEREKLITVAAQPGVAHRKQETRETHGKQQNQRENIFPEKLNRGRLLHHAFGDAWQS